MTSLAGPATLGNVRRSVRHAVTAHRRLLAAGLLAAAVAIGLDALSPAPAPTRSVITAGHDLPAGATLAAGDLQISAVPAALVPGGALGSVAAAVGHVLAGAVRQGEPLTDRRLVGRPLLASLARGRVAAPVRVADLGAAALVAAGDLVDVVAAPPGTDSREAPARVVAGAARVLTVVLGGDRSSAAEGGLLLLDVDASTGADLAAAAVSGRISVLLRPP